MGIYDRSNFYQLGEDSEGDRVLDVLAADWQGFRDNLILDVNHTVNQEEENDLPLISFKLYGDPSLWWILAQLNNIVNPLSDVTIGRDLLVPTKESVDRELRQIQISNDRIEALNTVTLPRRTV